MQKYSRKKKYYQALACHVLLSNGVGLSELATANLSFFTHISWYILAARYIPLSPQCHF